MTKQRDRKRFLLLALIMLAAILATRIPGLLHGLHQHSDEWVFYESTTSILWGEEGYQPAKLYPSGAFVFQLPFQALGHLFEVAFGLGSPAIFGRVAGLVYFSAGALLGLMVVYRLSGQNRWAQVFFAGIMVFSLFHIEQSRYGTGDPITFFLLMLILWFLGLYEDERRLPLLFAAAFAAGAMGAVKFPLLLFLAFPLASRLLAPTKKGRARDIVIACLLALAGILLFTPDFFRDPAFFFKVVLSETGAYHVGGGTSPLIFAKNFVVTIAYQLVYSDFPLALPLAVYGVWRLKRTRRQGGGPGPLWTGVVPVTAMVFLLANMFVGVFYYRSVYPWFFLCNLYAAVGLAHLVQMRRRWVPALVGVLSLAMALRGVALALQLTAPSSDAVVEALIAESGKAEESTGSVKLGRWFNVEAEQLPRRTYTYETETLRDDREGVFLQQGEFAVTTPYENYFVKHGPVPQLAVGDSAHMLENWQVFKAEHAAQYLGNTGSYSIDLLYGGWLAGSTLPLYEFPMSFVYYMDWQGARPDPEKLAQYDTLYAVAGPEEYRDALAGLNGSVLLAVGTAEELAFLMDEPPAGAKEGLYLIAREGAEVLHFGPVEGSVDLSGELGIPCVLVAEGGVLQAFRVAGREYLGQDGFAGRPQLIVYDRAFEQVMDWRDMMAQINDKH